MSITVFLVDNHAIVRDGLNLLITSESDMTVIGMAGNGRDAVTQIKKLRPNIVIMDITMTELNGIEACRYITESCLYTQVIMLSMSSGIEHILRSLQAGAKGYVVKEATGEDIIEAIRIVNGGGFFFSAGVLETMATYSADRQICDEKKDVQSLLSRREMETLRLIAEGKSTNEIAGILNISPKTVSSYRYRMMDKLKINNTPELIRFAMQNGLIPIC